MSTTRVLIFGFGPFLHIEQNPSERLVNLLQSKSDKYKIADRKVLPVDVQGMEKMLAEIDFTEVDFCIGFGVATATENVISLEKVAVNLLDSSSRDNADKILNNESIDLDAPPAFIQPMNLRELAERISLNQVKVQQSLSAGAYLCNALYYRLAQKVGIDRSLFIHIPEEGVFNEVQDAVENQIIPLLMEQVSP